jgi:hypothetical protein
MIKSRRMRWAVHVAHMEEIIKAYKILVRKCEDLIWPHKHAILVRTLEILFVKLIKVF